MGYRSKPGKEQAPVGFALRVGRMACNRSQEVWALSLGVSRKTIERWESGEVIPRQVELFAYMFLFSQPGNRRLIHLDTVAEAELLEAGMVEPWASTRAA